MYKNASENAQRQATQIWLRDLAGDCDVVLTPEQTRENLVAQLQAIEQKLLELPKGKRGVNEIRSKLGKQKYELQEQIRVIRPKMKGPRGVEGCFVDLCKEQMSAFQFRRLMDEASKRARDALSNQDVTSGTSAASDS